MESASSAEGADKTATGNDSAETVTPARALPATTSAPAVPPGATVRAAIRHSYAEDKIPVDLGPSDDEGGPRGTKEISETIRHQVTRTAHLEPLPRYFSKLLSRYVLIPGVIGQFEDALERLSEVLEVSYAQLAVPDRRRLLDVGWHEPLVALVNQEFDRYGEAQRAFKHVTAWLRHAVGYAEALIEMPDAYDYEAPPPPLDLKLRGHFNSFAEATMLGMVQNPERPGSDDKSPSPSQLGDVTATPGAGWKVKDTVVAAKVLMSPNINSFYGAPFKKDNRRKTSARNPIDFSRIDPMVGLLSPIKNAREQAAPPPVPFYDTIAHARAKPVRLPEKNAMTSYLAQDPAASFHTPERPGGHGAPARRDANSQGSLGPAGGGDPDDDDDDGDDDDPGGPQGRGYQPDPHHHAPPDGRGNPPDGGPERGGGGGGDPAGDPYARNAYQQAQRPQQGLTIDLRVKIDSLPAWDGNERTALKYFSQLNEWARAGRSGELFYQIPLVAPLRWSGKISEWFGNLTPERRELIQSGFHAFIPGIRNYYLTHRWAEERRAEFVAMHFRQREHERETPFDYINRRIFLARVLFDLSPIELVHEVLANTPPQWAYVIGEHNICDTDELMTRVVQLGPSLTSAYLAGTKDEEAEVLAKVEKMVEARIESWLKRNGAQVVSRAPVSNNPFRSPPPARPFQASARIADQQLDYALEPSQGHDSQLDQTPATTPEMVGAHAALVNSALAFLSSGAKTRPRPPGGYSFKESDVVSKVPPPSPCKVCGSDAHWDRECGHYQSYLLRKQQNVMYSSSRSADEERLYDAVYSVYANEAAFSSCVASEDGMSVLASFFAKDQPALAPPAAREAKRAVTVEEVEDEEDLEYGRIAKLEGSHILDEVAQVDVGIARAADELAEDLPNLLQVDYSDDEPDEDDGWELQETLQRAIFAQAMAAASSIAQEAGAPPQDLPHRDPEHPALDCVIRMPKKRNPPSAFSLKDISVLSCRGRVGSKDERTITIRLDSCANLCLVHRKFLDSLKHPPKIRRGMKVQIAQLTNNAPEIEGYVTMPMFIRGEDGAVLEFDLEAYVVPSMTVDLLVGEDWHINYEIDVLRSLEHGTRVRVGDSGYSFQATSLARDTLKAEREVLTVDARAIRVVHGHVASFVKAKSHRRARAARCRRRRATRNGELRAFRDLVIPPETTSLVDVAGHLAAGHEWFVERNLVNLGDGTFLSVPNALLSTELNLLPDEEEKPRIPRRYAIAVTNPTSRPCMLRAGTVVGYAKDPMKVLDVAKDEDDLEAKLATARALAVLIQELDTRSDDEKKRQAFACRKGAPEDSPGGPDTVNATSVESLIAEDVKLDQTSTSAPTDSEELPPPARAEAPDPVEYASADLEKILDLSPDLPAEVREQALKLLREHVLAFGFDGRLGHLQTNAKVRIKDDVDPIAVPMHGASPEKRQVIEEQLHKWIELGVIEDSISPWAAPVVIVYRNGKPRFCVDYRRLNAVTIADEFPIPRQADILSALSGAQVLSSLDALAGFNQMEIAQEDVEKTAFRTHMGLFQFRRMPFGLRNGPAIFQRVMQSILAPFLWLFTLVYIDDIVVYSATYGEHLEHLGKVLSAVEKAGLTLSPTKCHFFYSSILLLGHKVSRLGLSTHEEKVLAIAALESPRKLSTLQTFLGMVVYFQAFIPYYSFVVAPLFRLLRKDVPWRWGEEEQHAFEQAKRALQAAPVLGHPQRHKPYRLYTDASDEALGACLQQVQPILVADLKGTPVYERLRRAFEAGEPMPQLCTKLSSKTNDVPDPGPWASTLDESTVHVERVVCYWSRTFKDAEKNYSATEREGLAAKEALVKFQPFVEGEQVILITDHAALQWAKTWEHTNRRLAAWGAVFAAFTGLEIVHRAGRLHSNVDPLSRLPRSPPEFIAPVKDPTAAIKTNVDAAELLDE